MKKLFCIPPAGGTSYTFINWKVKLEDKIMVCPVELSGKGVRNSEKIHKSFNDAVNDIYTMVSYNLKKGESYAIFGHSMGALLAYELYYRLEENNMPLPDYVILSGMTYPNQYSCEKIIKKNVKEFETYIMGLGGVPPNINKKLKKIIMKMVWDDYCILNTYCFEKRTSPIKSNLYIFNGIEDKITLKDNVEKWSVFASKPVKRFLFQGGHFFINNSFIDIMNIILKINLHQV